MKSAVGPHFSAAEVRPDSSRGLLLSPCACSLYKGERIFSYGRELRTPLTVGLPERAHTAYLRLAPILIPFPA
jgi:hypothetical protein